MSAFELAVCSEMVLTSVPIIDRVRRITDMGYAGTIGLQAWASGDSAAALAAFRAAFAT